MKTLIAAACLAIGVAATPAFAGFPDNNCKPRDFEFKQFDVVREPDSWVHVIGEIVNHCRAPATFTFQRTYRDASGRVIHVRDFSGPGGDNIQPGESFTFDHSDDVGAQWSTTDRPKIQNIVQWPD
jgi:hypothetical protein